MATFEMRFAPTPRDASPSAYDVNVTRELVKAGKLLDIEVLDHVVIAHNTHSSLKEHNLGFDAL